MGIFETAKEPIADLWDCQVESLTGASVADANLGQPDGIALAVRAARMILRVYAGFIWNASPK